MAPNSDSVSGNNPSNDKIYFSNQRTAIPFGKFESGADDVFPCNESMVGREGARAKLIDFLTNAGTRKAILVTGRRGMGKTSFVQYCLNEYQESRVERYWRSDFGRTIFSLVWLLIISFLSASAFVIATQLLPILLHNAISGKGHFLWIIIALLFLSLAYPFFIAGNIFTIILKPFLPVAPNFLGLFSVALVAGVATYLFGNESSIITLSRLLVVISAIYFIGGLINFIRYYSEKTILRLQLGHVVILAFSGLMLWLTYFQPVIASSNEISVEQNAFVNNILIAAQLFGWASLNRAIDYHLKADHLRKIQIAYAIKNSKIWFFWLGGLVFTLSTIIAYVNFYGTNWFFLLGIVLSSIIRCFHLIREPEKKQSNNYRKQYVYPSSLLAIKAVFFITLSLHAIFLSTQYSNFFSSSRSSNGELLYIVMLISIVALLFWIEYEWIIRPAQFMRRDQATFMGRRPNYYGDTEPKEPSHVKEWDNKNAKNNRNIIQEYINNQANIRERYRAFEKLTFLHHFSQFHFSTIVTTINLGFEELDHRSVIYAMLLGIREQYQRKLVSLSSPRVLIRSAYGVVLAMVLVASLSDEFFNPISLNENLENPTDSQDKNNKFDNIQKSSKKTIDRYEITYLSNNDIVKNKPNIKISEFKKKTVHKYCPVKAITNEEDIYKSLPRVPRLLCELGGLYSEKLLPIIYFELSTIELEKNKILVNGIFSWPFDIRKPYYAPNAPEEISLCIYHIILFILVFCLFRRLNKIFGFVPYGLNLAKIEDLLDALTSTTKTKKNRDYPTAARWLSSLAGRYQENEKSIERTTLDPRAVELEFMRVLEEISHSRPSYFKLLQSGKYSPSIEITFVFDELDKLATDINSQVKQGHPDSNDSELHRLNLMKGLLSNMKRIITSSEARYIFLGGRLLHDDWLADGARRQPLLTSIFSDEIYLPSLLCDIGIGSFQETDKETKSDTLPGSLALHERIEEFFTWQYYLARKRFEDWALRIWMPVSGLRDRNARPRGFIQVSYKNLKSLMRSKTNFSLLETIPIKYTDTGVNMELQHERARLEAFIHFLNYRSVGNPKRLNELLASFMISADRAVPKSIARDEGFNCQDVLYLPDHKVMRIQFISRVYQYLRKGFEEKIRGRDDKTIVALIYLSDFLFKFHERAFSWESLELIDELVHMHRGHDLRVLLHELVEHYSDRYLHRIVNGMYAYRFRSYFANEVEYLSRHSDEEMAAFNFTLDEAQTLRDHLQKLLDQSDNRDKTDILTMLGELHEFYQEYEMARQYYRRCIHARQPMLKDHVGDKVGKGDEEMSVLQAIYSNTPEGRRALLALQQWGPVTLRLFLKIVMTYELEHNYNDALIRYERCIKFAECIIQAFATVENESSKPYYFWKNNSADLSSQPDHTYTLEYLGLLFEPLFAYAWLLEKNSYTSGNSLRILEAGIKNYEKLLESVPVKERINFVRAQWYKKVGALCFYKGLANIDEEYYITKARKYYLESAKNLSFYFRQGVHTTFDHKKAESFPSVLLLDYYPSDYNLSVAECLGDLSEYIYSTVCPIKLFETTRSNSQSIPIGDFEKQAINIIYQLDDWFFNSQRKGDICILDWLAKLNYSQDKFEYLSFRQKLDLALNMSMASSFYLLRAGYVESAAREVMHIAEIIAQYLNWYGFIVVTEGNKKELGFGCIWKTMEKIIWYTTYLPWLLRVVRSRSYCSSDKKPNQEDSSDILNGLIPGYALTSLCSIGLFLSSFEKHHFNELDKQYAQEYLNKLKEIIKKWIANSGSTIDEPDDNTCTDSYKFFEEVLTSSLQQQRYPVLNQLNALKILVDASLVYGYLSSDYNFTANTRAWLQELYHINEKYNNPFHFTPMQLGFSLYLYGYIKKRSENLNNRLYSIKDFDLHAETRRLLIQNLDMCHMGRGYFAAIEKLYYLYDDFNDNEIHRNHAMQMASDKLTNNALVELRQSCLDEMR